MISGNTTDGVLIVNSGSTLNIVQGNFIGTNASGENRLGNGRYGIEISQPNNVIGGKNAGNVVSGQRRGRDRAVPVERVRQSRAGQHDRH